MIPAGPLPFSQPRPIRPALVFALCTLAAGLLTRPAAKHGLLPPLIAKHSGDALYTVFAYALLALMRPAWNSRLIAAVALTFSVAIEFSQIYHAPWINSIRRTTLGGLILGWGFAWEDIFWYAAGGLAAYLIDVRLLQRRKGGPRSRTVQ